MDRMGERREMSERQETGGPAGSRRRVWTRAGAAAAGLALAVALAAPGPAAGTEWIFEPRPQGAPEVTNPPLPPTTQFPVQLILDDDGVEGSFGVVAGSSSRQFLWLNRFSVAEATRLEQVWVLFTPDQGGVMQVGDPIQLAVYYDADGDPSNGASLLATQPATIQVLDGMTFSIYDLAPAVTAPSSGDVLVGVVSRFVESGVTPPVAPASMDLTASQGRSWIGVWSGDPPDPPVLVPLPDQDWRLVDDFQPGNFMVRAFGSPATSALEIPTLGGAGLALLAALLSLTGLALLRRRPLAEDSLGKDSR